MLVRCVTYSLIPVWNASPKFGLVNFCLFTSSWLELNCTYLPYHVSPSNLNKQTNMSLPLISVSCVGGRKIRFRRLRTCVQNFDPPDFFKVIFDYHDCFGLAIRKLSVLFIYLFIHSFNQFQLIASNLEQVLAATPHNTPTIRPPASYHENYPS